MPDILQASVIAPIVILALLLNPLAYGQQPGCTPSGTGGGQSGCIDAVQNQTPAYAAAATTPSASQSPPASGSADQIPDSPGTVRAQTLLAGSQENPQSAPQEPPPEQPRTQEQAQGPPQEPVGTAAAEYVPTVGVAGSRPAGAALAPAKQRRVRSILIKTGVLVGAGVALGATMALSQGSPGRPPGTH